MRPRCWALIAIHCARSCRSTGCCKRRRRGRGVQACVGPFVRRARARPDFFQQATPMIKQALISVSDKTGVLDFARALSALGVNILSTGGTAKLLQDNGVPVTEVADYT